MTYFNLFHLVNITSNGINIMGWKYIMGIEPCKYIYSEDNLNAEAEGASFEIR